MVQRAKEPQWSVACLCAAWCGVCEQYRPTFEALKARFPHWQLEWVDVEDEAAVMEEVDIETFPTLLIAQGSQVVFMGPLLPQIQVLERLMQSLEGGVAQHSAVTAQAQDLWLRWCAHKAAH